MVRFTIGEYIKNIWYNVVTILIFAATFIVSTIFLSNISAQTRVYRFLKPYLNDQSIIIAMLEGFDINTLSKVDKTLMTNELYCYSDDIKKLSTCVVYNEYAMENMTPRLSEGKHIDKVKADDNTIKILVSENKKGVGAGDIVTLEFFDTNASIVKVNALVTGVIAEGQMLFMQNEYIKSDMSVEELYLSYSYEQMQYPVVITTEEEINKIANEVTGMNYRCIVKFQDDITQEERQDNYDKIIGYEMDKHGYSTGTAIFPSSEKLCDRMEANLERTLMKYIPLTVAVFILIIVCVIGMVSIKTANSMRYYGTLYICGMPYSSAVIMTGVEMIINAIVALVISISLITIQNKLSIVGTINCEIGSLQAVVIAVMCIVTIGISMLMTRIVLKEKTPAAILTDTTY